MEIDNKRMWEFLAGYKPSEETLEYVNQMRRDGYTVPFDAVVVRMVIDALKDQGFKFDGEKIVPIEEKSEFKVGDWLATNYGKVNQVVSVDKDGDGYTLDDDVYFSGSWCDMYHLWTISDAKNGDVLACESGWTCIFKSINKYFKDSFCSYCFMDKDGWFCSKGSNTHTTDERINGKLYPATKEQRELLFSRMKEAGYEWDAEKKEVKIWKHD